MATFAFVDTFDRSKPSFAYAGYAASRPVYPRKLYNVVLSYHRGPRETAVDLGSGHGVVARGLSPFFGKVIATDPSEGMLEEAKKKTAAFIHDSEANPSGSGSGSGGQTASDPDVAGVIGTAGRNISFQQASAEHLPFLASGSVDMVAAGQAAHWFDADAYFGEMARVLRPGGTLAAWGYKDHVFVGCPQASAVLDRRCHATTGSPPGDYGLGDYWAQPGRRRVQNKLRDLVPPASDWEDVRRVEYEPGAAGPRTGEGEIFLEKRMKIAENMQYVRTWSSYHAWKEKHPDRRSRQDGGQGDIVDDIFDEMKSVEPEWRAEPDETWLDKEVDVEWGSGLLLARRK